MNEWLNEYRAAHPPIDLNEDPMIVEFDAKGNMRQISGPRIDQPKRGLLSRIIAWLRKK